MAGARWLSRLQELDANVARELIEEILLVSTDQLIAALRNSLEDILEGQNRSGADPSRHPIALYAEREMSKDGERVSSPFFLSSERGRAPRVVAWL